MKAITAGTMAFAVASGFRIDRSLAAASGEPPQPLTFGPPPTQGVGERAKFDEPRTGVIWFDPERPKAFLQGTQPAPNCRTLFTDNPTYDVEYVNITTGNATATCPDIKPGEFFPEASYPTYQISSTPERIYMQRPLHSSTGPLCLDVHTWNAEGRKVMLDASTMVQSSAVAPFKYREECVAAPIAPTLAPTSSAPTASERDHTGTLIVAGLAALGAVSGILVCAVRRARGAQPVPPPDNAVELAVLVDPQAVRSDMADPPA
ncbi:MAG: hypothetical protein H7255_13440 [Ramlibacter sp.]|nr:hypothetical protein [Ramlibacter sp.]